MIQLTIAICTFNRSDFLVKALESLANQSLGTSEYEILIVNNNSTDSTEDVCLLFEKEHPNLNFQYVTEPRQGLSYARNKAIRHARGEFLAFIDDDASADPVYAESIIEAFMNYEEYSALGGKVSPFYDPNVEVKWLSKYIWGMVAKVDQGDKIKAFSKKYPAGCNMAFRKSIFEKIGLFNIELAKRCDDRYIFSRIKKHRLKVLYYPNAKVRHYIPKSRITEEGIVKLAKLNGSEHRKLLNASKINVFIKLLDYIIKLLLSLILAFFFIVTFQPKKMKIVKIMYYSLIGFIKGA